MLKKLFLDTTNNINTIYDSIRDSNVSPDHMRTILFEDEVILDENMMSLVEDSFLTNSLDSIKEKTRIIPKTSIVSM